MEAIVKTYDARLDNKKRLTIRGTRYDFYRIQEFDDGTLDFKPFEIQTVRLKIKK